MYNKTLYIIHHTSCIIHYLCRCEAVPCPSVYQQRTRTVRESVRTVRTVQGVSREHVIHALGGPRHGRTAEGTHVQYVGGGGECVCLCVYCPAWT